MRAIKTQYFLAYAVTGSILPYLPVYLAHYGLSETQIGWALTATGIAIMVTPGLMTFLADTHLENKTLLATIFILSGAALVGLWFASGFWPIFIAYICFALAFMPNTPLRDGLIFKVQQQRRAAGKPVTPYHRVRVYGTVGFIAPSLLLYVWLSFSAPVDVVLAVAVGFCVLALVNTCFLPRVREKIQSPESIVQSPESSGKPPSPREGQGEGVHSNVTGSSRNQGDEDMPGSSDVEPEPSTSSSAVDSLPQPLPEGGEPEVRVPIANASKVATHHPLLAAARMMLEPRILLFCICLWLVQIASATYYAFYPLYLTQQLGLEVKWVGLIANLGVAVEIFFMLSFGWLLRKLGMKKLMALGAGCMALRMALLFAFPTVAVAVGTQSLHGMMVLVLHVAPPIFLNRYAADAYRNSIQGLYAVTVYGSGRIIGAACAGYIAAISLPLTFGCAAGVCVVVMALFLFAFREREGEWR